MRLEEHERGVGVGHSAPCNALCNALCNAPCNALCNALCMRLEERERGVGVGRFLDEEVVYVEVLCSIYTRRSPV